MSLTTVSGEIQAQPLNDNFSYLFTRVQDFAIVTDFGAVGDGTTDDTASFQNAIDDCITNNRILIVPATTSGYLIGDLTIDGRLTILGVGGNRAKLIAKASTLKMFSIQYREIRLENLWIEMDSATDSSSCVFFFDTATYGTIYDIHIKNIRVWRAYCCIKDSNSSGVFTNTYIEDLTCVYAKGTQIIIHDSIGFVFFTKVAIDLTLNSSTVTFPACTFFNASGLILQDFDTVGHGFGGSFDVNANGIELSNCTSVWFNRVMCDYLGNWGVVISNSNYIYLNDFNTSICLGGGVSITDTNFVVGSNVRVGGTSGQSYAVANKYGVYLLRVATFNVGTIYSYSNTNDGFYFKDCSRLQVGTLQSNTNTGYGIHEEQTSAGSSVANIISNALTAGNTSGNATITSTSTYIASIMLNSGSAVFQQVGPVAL